MTEQEFADWLIIKWLGDASMGDISISRRARDDLNRRISIAIAEAYAAGRKEVLAKWPSREEQEKDWLKNSLKIVIKDETGSE